MAEVSQRIVGDWADERQEPGVKTARMSMDRGHKLVGCDHGLISLRHECQHAHNSHPYLMLSIRYVKKRRAEFPLFYAACLAKERSSVLPCLVCDVMWLWVALSHHLLVFSSIPFLACVTVVLLQLERRALLSSHATS